MQRRKFLVGMGSLAAGTGAVFGTSATQYSVNDRTASIDVVSDNPNGVIGFKDTSPGDIINQTDDKIEIDFAEHTDSKGVNVGSQIVIGNIRDEAEFDGVQPNQNYSPFSEIGDASIVDENPGSAAFKIINQAAGTELTFDVIFEFDSGGNVNHQGSVLAFYMSHKATSGHEELVVSKGSADDVGSGKFVQEGISNNLPSDGIDPGEEILVAVAVDTDRPNSSTGENLSGTLTFEAEPV